MCISHGCNIMHAMERHKQINLMLEQNLLKLHIMGLAATLGKFDVSTGCQGGPLNQNNTLIMENGHVGPVF